MAKKEEIFLESFPFKREWYDVIRSLDDELRVRVYDSLFSYVFHGVRMSDCPVPLLVDAVIRAKRSYLSDLRLENVEKERSGCDMSLFEDCWKAYHRKGNKKKSVEQWCKLSEKERTMCLSHIKAYVSSRDLQYQKDFERYLRDKVFDTIVFKDNKVVFDPTKASVSDSIDDVYMPVCDGALSWNDYYKCYMYMGFWDGHVSDGYSDETRPDGACITLNNGRGTIVWNRSFMRWELN